MSLSFRPVREEWGEACSCFVDADEVVRLLRLISQKLGITSEHHNYADTISVWVEDGKRLLDHMQSERFTAKSVAALTGLKAKALTPLVGNMKALANGKGQSAPTANSTSTWMPSRGSRDLFLRPSTMALAQNMSHSNK